ncbi:ARPP-2 domain-containing protein [Streptomyces bacillaris]|uniref:ARPP-2 domain-containing protein n=1 Tax=Streptomyces rhizosphaericola TaxID=2564098 RepID=UPI0039F1014A
MAEFGARIRGEENIRTLAGLRAAARGRERAWEEAHDRLFARRLLNTSYGFERVYRMGSFTLWRFLLPFVRDGTGAVSTSGRQSPATRGRWPTSRRSGSPTPRSGAAICSTPWPARSGSCPGPPGCSGRAVRSWCGASVRPGSPGFSRATRRPARRAGKGRRATWDESPQGGLFNVRILGNTGFTLGQRTGNRTLPSCAA